MRLFLIVLQTIFYMKVSIIIPVYGVEKYIEPCILSVMNQSMTDSVECIIVDDCGSDKSIQIVERMVSEYKGDILFSILYHDYNKGPSSARNTGMRVAKGQYIYFLDSDDTITPDCIERMWKKVEEYPGVNCVFSGIKTIGADLVWMDYTLKKFPPYSEDRDWLQESMLKRFEFSMTGVNRLISADFIREYNLYFEEGFLHEDDIWNLRISQNITKAAFVNANTYNYIIHNNSIMTSAKGNDEIYFERRFRLQNRMLDRVKGYRKGIQPYYIVILASECLPKISNIKDYLKLMNFVVRAIIKSEGKYRFRLMRILLSWNKYFLKRILK